MSSKISLSLFTIIFLLIFSCDFKPQPAEKVKALAEEVARRKVKQVTNIQLLEEMKSISSALILEINTSNIDSIESANKCVVRKIHLKATTFPDSISHQLADAYNYSISLGQPLKAFSQFSLDEKHLIYTEPLLAVPSDSVTNAFWYVKFLKKEIILKL